MSGSSATPPFVHLHVHSDGSLLDGGNTVDRLIARAQSLQMPGFAITDHGVLYSARQFYDSAKKAGIKPIIGMEAYVAPGARSDKTVKSPTGKNYYHLVLLARDRVGYQNLVKLSSIGYTEGFYYKPRIDREVLERYGEGLIVSSACMAGEVAQHLELGDEQAARAAVEWYAEVFKDRYFLEVQAHNTPGQRETNRKIFQLSEQMGVPVLATTDAHFLQQDEHKAHDCLIKIGARNASEDGGLAYDEGLYFKSASEVQRFFPDRPDVLTRTAEIAEACALALDSRYHVPAFPIGLDVKAQLAETVAAQGGVAQVLPPKVAADPSLSEADKEQQALEAIYLRALATAGAERRYGAPLPAHVAERLEYELGVITTTGYSGYFLIVADFIQAARDRDIPVGPGRGSAAGSLVAYALGITNLCPITYDLLFERFLNPDRVSMPDIDVDFCFERRAEVIDYVRQKYGEEAVCQIVTFGTLKARAVVKDVGRVLGFSPKEMDTFAKLIPNAPNNALTVAEAVEKVEEVYALYHAEPARLNEAGTASYKELCDLAMKLEGLRRHASVHAAGVVIAPGPVENYVPVSVQTDKDPLTKQTRTIRVTQYDMNGLEKSGMLKMDFLGLKTLTVLQQAVQMIGERHAHPLDLDGVTFDDAATYSLLASGKTLGVFQFESDLAREKLMAMRPTCFDDIVAASALLRPGPLDTGMTDKFIARKRGKEAVDFPHPMLQDALKDTQGIITYQEQIMRAAQILAGYTLAEADVLRKAVGKKDAKLIASELARFKDRAMAAGTCDRQQADDLAGLIETFGRYGFNKSHSAAYGVLSFQTAYLKKHYTPEFVAALLSCYHEDTDYVVSVITEARELGVPVLGPSVNASKLKFSVVTTEVDGAPVDTIRFGLTAIKGVGEGVVTQILDARREGGPFTDFFEFVRRTASARLNKSVIEALIHAGACDGLGANRAQMLAVAEHALKAAAKARKEEEIGQISLFGDPADAAGIDASLAIGYPDLAEVEERERLAEEKQVLGVYVSGHPLEQFADAARALATHTAQQCKVFQAGTVRVVGVVTAVDERIARASGKRYAKLQLEDLTGTMGLVAFGDTWGRFSFQLQPGALVVVDGKFRESDQDAEQAPDLMIDAAQGLMDAMAAGELALTLRMDRDLAQNKSSMERVKALLEMHAGVAPVLVEVESQEGPPATKKAQSRVRLTPHLLTDLRSVLGPARVGVCPNPDLQRPADRGGRGRGKGRGWH